MGTHVKPSFFVVITHMVQNLHFSMGFGVQGLYIYISFWNFRHGLVRYHWFSGLSIHMCALIYQKIMFPFFCRISAFTVLKQITRNHFGLSFEANNDRTVFRVSQKKPKCSDNDSLFVLVVGTVVVDVGSSKGRLRPQRGRVSGWEAGFFSVALWIARPQGPWPWRGRASTLALATAPPSLPSVPSVPSVPSISSHQQYQHQHHYHQHHHQYHYQHQYQHHYNPSLRRDRRSPCDEPDRRVCCYSGKSKYRGGASGNSCTRCCRLLRCRRRKWEHRLSKSRWHRQSDGFLGISRLAIPGTWWCFWGSICFQWHYLSGSSGRRCVETYFVCFAKCCRVDFHLRPFAVQTWSVCMTDWLLYAKKNGENIWKYGCLNQLQKCQMSVSEGVSQMWNFYDSGTPIRWFQFIFPDFKYRKFRNIYLCVYLKIRNSQNLEMIHSKSNWIFRPLVLECAIGIYPVGSMYGTFTYIYHFNQL